MGQPIRTCVGCRRRRPQRELLRFQVGPDGKLVAVVRPGKGRSAYLCPDYRCFRKAVRRRAFGRSLRCVVAVGSAEDLARQALVALTARVEMLGRSAPGHTEVGRLRRMAQYLAQSLEDVG